MKASDKNNHYLISYLTLRKAIGVLGIALPVVVTAGSVMIDDCTGLLPSISDYYHTNLRNIFTGIMCSVAIFLFTYRGPDRQDGIAGKLGCIFALGLAFFPTVIDDATCRLCEEAPLKCDSITPQDHWMSKVHMASALLFFLVLIYFSLFLFTKSNTSHPTPEKIIRNRLYRVCGYTMLACIILLVVYVLFISSKYPVLEQYNIIFWLETIALTAFGVSWLVKGELILKDGSVAD